MWWCQRWEGWVQISGHGAAGCTGFRPDSHFARRMFPLVSQLSRIKLATRLGAGPSMQAAPGVSVAQTPIKLWAGAAGRTCLSGAPTRIPDPATEAPSGVEGLEQM